MSNSSITIHKKEFMRIRVHATCALRATVSLVVIAFSKLETVETNPAGCCTIRRIASLAAPENPRVSLSPSAASIQP